MSRELQGGHVVLVMDETTELLDVDSSVASETELMVADKPDGISVVLVEGEEAAVVTEIAASPAAGAAAATERILFCSSKVDLTETFVVVLETELSMLGAETVSEVAMEGLVFVAELEVTERLGVMDSEEVGVTEAEVGASVGVVVLVSVVCKVEEDISVVEALVSEIEALLSSTAPLVGVVAAVVGLTESVHIYVSEGVTVLEGETVKLVESRFASEIVGSVGAVVVVRAGAAGVDGAAAALSLVGVCVSASCIWASSFSGVLRPDVVGGGPGLITGFGSKAGFPAASCAETLARI